MGKHGTGYERPEHDLYATIEPHIVNALAAHVQLQGSRIWEPACGNGDMAAALRLHGADVYTSDLVYRGLGQDEQLDFLSRLEPRFSEYDLIVSNPPGGLRNATAVAFVERGLEYVARRGVTLALLLPADFDSAVTRRRLFADCRYFAASIVLTRRCVWFQPANGKRAAPKENHRWFLWTADRNGEAPAHLYDPDARAAPAASAAQEVAA
jgi:hypothetical protein